MNEPPVYGKPASVRQTRQCRQPVLYAACPMGTTARQLPVLGNYYSDIPYAYHSDYVKYQLSFYYQLCNVRFDFYCLPTMVPVTEQRLVFYLLSTVGALAVGVVSAATPDLASLLGDACFLNISRASIPPRLFGRPFP